MPVSLPHLCGICGARKTGLLYDAGFHGKRRWQEVLLCNRCDLSPDPPVKVG